MINLNSSNLFKKFTNIYNDTILNYSEILKKQNHVLDRIRSDHKKGLNNLIKWIDKVL